MPNRVKIFVNLKNSANSTVVSIVLELINNKLNLFIVNIIIVHLLHISFVLFFNIIIIYDFS